MFQVCNDAVGVGRSAYESEIAVVVCGGGIYDESAAVDDLGEENAGL